MLLSIPPEFKIPLAISFGLHVTLFIVSLIGLPFLVRDLPDITVIPIEIELAEVSDKTRAPEPLTAPEPKRVNTDSDKPPDLIKPKEEPKPEPKKEEPLEKKQPEPEPVVVPNPDVKPRPPEKKEEKKPEPKKEEVTKVEEKPDEAKDFSSILKDLTPEDEEKKDDMKRILTDMTGEGNNAPDIGDKITIDETQAVVQHIYPCWNIPSGAKYAEDLVVKIRMKMNSDGTVQSASIVDQTLLGSDPAYQAAGDAALRAVRNPKCSPLPFPPDKYEQWKDVILNFDPRGML